MPNTQFAPALATTVLTFLPRIARARSAWLRVCGSIRFTIVRRALFQVFVAWFAFTGSTSIAAGDWPQILGPNRDGQAVGQAPFQSHWPADVLDKPAWQISVGSGFAGAVIVQKKAFLFHRHGPSEILQAVDADTGKPVWKVNWDSTYRSSMNPDSGPRSTPVVTAGKIICYGAAGDLACVDVESGRLLWNKPLRKDFDAEDGYFGAGTTPLVHGGVVIVNVGGNRGGIVGVDLQSGAVKWTATNYDASYSSPIALVADGKSAALVVTRLNAVLLETESGKVLSDVPFGSRGPTVNASTPIRVAGGKYFLTASYGVGALLLDVSSTKMTALYRSGELISSQYNTPVQVDRHLIGIDGREDIGQASLRAINPFTQEVVWEEAGVGPAHLIAVGNRVLSVNVGGEVRLVDGSATKYTQLAIASLPPGTYRALPALANSQLVVRRSLDGDSGEFLCYRLPTEK